MAQYGAYKYESVESRALKGINADSYNKDQAKNLIQLNQNTEYMAQYMRKLQKGVDDANKNVIEQIQGFINDIIVLLGGGGNTGLDFGDLKYVFQAIGALFGFTDNNGNIQLPVNLFQAAWHFFSTYIIPLNGFGDVINALIDNTIAGILDALGEIPIIGEAAEQLAMFISDMRDFSNNMNTAINNSINEIIDWIGQAASLLFKQGMDWQTFLNQMNDWTTGSMGSYGVTLEDIFASGQALFETIFDTGVTAEEAAEKWHDLLVNLGLPDIPGLSTMLAETKEKAAEAAQQWEDFLVGLGLDDIPGLIDILTGKADQDDWMDLIHALFGGGATGPASTIQTAAVPNLDGSKITSGSISQAFLNITSIAAGLVSGALSSANIPGLDASKIISGIFGTGVIPNLDAAKIVTGIFGTSRIPNLDGSKITSGSISQTFLNITNIASSLISGVLSSLNIPNIDASKITSGTLATAQVPDVTFDMSSGIQSLVNSIVGGITGAESSSAQISAVLSALGEIPQSNIVIDPSPGAATVTLDASASKIDSTMYSFAGGQYYNWTHVVGSNANYALVFIKQCNTNTFSYVTSVTIGGKAMQSLGRFTHASPGDSYYDFIEVFGVQLPPKGSQTVQAYVLCSGSLVGTQGLFVGCSTSWIGVGGVGSVIWNAANSGATMSLSGNKPTNNLIVQGAASRVISGSGALQSYNKTSIYNSNNVSGSCLLVGSGAGSASWSGTAGIPGTNPSWATVGVPLTPLGSVIGSTAKVYRNTTSATSVFGSSGDFVVPSGAFNATDYISPDITWDGQKFTVSVAATYVFTVCARLSYSFTGSQVGALMYVSRNGGSVALCERAPHTYLGANNVTQFGHTWEIVLNPGDTVQPGFNAGQSVQMIGDTNGAVAYCKLTMANRSLM